ncbi:hypothetical protein J2T08_001125 [Neorhizobium galegae]|nr:hypothetical protein [Neorhizobium galegae]MBP2560452.1 hypothetical protein [Neorhizobium galegae]MDQ0133224.1 hypothetical protein [Neorhizobium galegae]
MTNDLPEPPRQPLPLESLIENAGHSTADQGMAEAIIAAANRFADGA